MHPKWNQYWRLATKQRKKPDLHGFTIDHEVKNTFKAPDRQAETLAVLNLEHNASSIKNWMDYDSLNVNDGKTEFIMF